MMSGMTLSWRAAGTPRGTAVLLHGLMAQAATWWRIGPALADAGWETSAVDLPGHGQAPRLPRADDPDGLDLDQFVAALAERLPDRVDLLVGHSLGAVAALALAVRRPEIARALVLEEPPGMIGEGERVLLSLAVEADGELVAQDRAAVVHRERTGHPDWAEQDVLHYVDGIAAADVPAIAAALRAPLQADLPGLLTGAVVPVLVLAGTEARGSALRGDRAAVRDLLPPGRFVELDAGHCPHREEPAGWLAAVSAFTAATLA
jgi:pimeloyl-ACP methyl ester carboxylesterase